MAYDVHLETFEGPLDLLLHLIKKNDLEIAEIPIAQITTEYLSYMDLMRECNLDIAGEFLVMASTLMQIKARMLLPKQENEEEDGPDPLEELKTRLSEYQKFKEIAQVLSFREQEFAQMYARPLPHFEQDDFVIEVSLFDLMNTFNKVLQELPSTVKEIVYQEIPIEQKIREILDMLEAQETTTFYEILTLQKSRMNVVVCFLAVLELVRLKQIIIRQNNLFDEIRLYRVKEDVSVAATEPDAVVVAEPAPVLELDVQEAADAGTVAVSLENHATFDENTPEPGSSSNEPLPESEESSLTKDDNYGSSGN